MLEGMIHQYSISYALSCDMELNRTPFPAKQFLDANMSRLKGCDPIYRDPKRLTHFDQYVREAQASIAQERLAAEMQKSTIGGVATEEEVSMEFPTPRIRVDYTLETPKDPPKEQRESSK